MATLKETRHESGAAATYTASSSGWALRALSLSILAASWLFSSPVARLVPIAISLALLAGSPSSSTPARRPSCHAAS